MIVKARFLLPMDGPPIEDGALQFENGRIVAIGRAPDFPPRAAEDYGDAVILPGLVNAHTHLELSLLAGRVPPSDNFVDWLHRLIRTRREDVGAETEAPAYVRKSTQKGIAESISSGVTTVGDISAFPQYSRPVLAASPLRGVSYGEVIAMGKGRELLAQRLAAATDPACVTSRLRIGVSPHAPYTVEPQAMRTSAQRAKAANFPICIHVAETAEEAEFTQERHGPFVDFLNHLGIWDEQIPCADSSPVELLSTVGLLGPRTLLAHANYVSDVDIDLIAQSGANVAYCPRTHAAFGHPPHRFREMMRRGVNVCLGTDSLASNPSISILEELHFLRIHYPDLAPVDLLEMGTTRGARGLGLEKICGSLTPGKAADFLVLADHGRDWQFILDEPTMPLTVYIDGVQVRGTDQKSPISVASPKL